MTSPNISDDDKLLDGSLDEALEATKKLDAKRERARARSKKRRADKKASRAPKQRSSPGSLTQGGDGYTGVVMTIDPGTRVAGWATWNIDRVGRAKPVVRLLKHSVCKMGRRADWRDRIRDGARELDDIVQSSGALRVIIEEPQNMGGGGRGGAARNAGSIVMLMGMVQYIRAVIEYTDEVDVVLVPVSVWKGQLPKDVTWARFVKNWGDRSTATNDEQDALALGDWYLRRLFKCRIAK